MTLFDLVAKLTMDSSEFDKGVRKAESAGNSLSDKMSGMFDKIEKGAKALVGGAVVKKVVDTIKSLANDTAEAGDKIDKQSQVLGMSRKAYQEWDYILGQNGASIESMSTSMKTLNNLILSGVDGSKESADSLAELGLHLENLNDLSQEDQFETVVRAFQEMPAGAQKSALAVKVFGKQGMQLLPLLNQSSTSIDELRARAEELGLIMSDDAVDAAVVYGDSLDDLHRTFDGFKYAIGSKILPVLTTGIQKVTNYAGKLRKAYDEKGIAGVWDTLVESFKNIKWPTWEDVKGALERAWNGVKEGAKSVLKLVFGESPDGDIAFPTPEEIETKVKEALTNMWEGVKNLAKSVLKLIFGEGEDGGIEFPSAEEIWGKIGDVLRGIWQSIQGFAKGILKFVFGETEDGGIKFPTAQETWEKIKEVISAWWSWIKAEAKTILNFVLSDVLGLPKIEDVIEQIRQWWEDVKKSLGDLVLNIVTKLTDQTGTFQGGDPTGPSWGETIDAPDVSNVGWNAKGMWSVPYDGYRTELHRNERVLSASQARKMDNGGSSDYSSMASTIANAVKEAIENADIRSYINERDVTDNVNRANMRQIKARRFAT